MISQKQISDIKSKLYDIQHEMGQLIYDNCCSRLRYVAPDSYNEGIRDEADDTLADMHQHIDKLIMMAEYLFNTKKIKVK